MGLYSQRDAFENGQCSKIEVGPTLGGLLCGGRVQDLRTTKRRESNVAAHFLLCYLVLRLCYQTGRARFCRSTSDQADNGAH